MVYITLWWPKNPSLIIKKGRLNYYPTRTTFRSRIFTFIPLIAIINSYCGGIDEHADRKFLAPNNCRACWWSTGMLAAIGHRATSSIATPIFLRDVQDLEKEFPDHEEIKTFIQVAAPLLAEAMNLRSLPISDDEFYQRAAKTKEEIIKIMNSEANHFGIQRLQNIFRENSHRLYPWADNRDVPADNNFAERELRPLVMARKVSFGSHSDAGAKTRETM